MTEHLFEPRGLYYRTNMFHAGRQTLVFVHGVSGSSSAWRSFEARFEHRYNLLTYDLRGHGKSQKYRQCGAYAIAHFVEDLKALLDHLSVDRCVLISHSFAVLITLEFLRLHEDVVDAAVLLSADFDVGRHIPARILKVLVAPVDLLEWLPFRPRTGAHVDYTHYPDSGDWNVPRMLADIGNTTWRVFLYCTKQSYAVHADAWLATIRVPVLLMHGQRDTIFSVESARYMATRIPRVELLILDDADHILVLNRPREVGDAIEGFLHRLADNRSLTPSPSLAQATTGVHDARQSRTGDDHLKDPERA